MAKTSQQRSADAAARRKERGEEELRHRVRPGIRSKLDELMAWHGIEEMAEALQLAIMNLHALGPEGSAHAFTVPRHEIHISESVARRLFNEGRNESESMESDDDSLAAPRL